MYTGYVINSDGSEKKVCSHKSAQAVKNYKSKGRADYVDLYAGFDKAIIRHTNGVTLEGKRVDGKMSWRKIMQEPIPTFNIRNEAIALSRTKQ